MADNFEILEQIVRRTGIRHGVIASNIANADTPNYKARDINFQKALDEASLELKKTNPRHIDNNGSVISEEIKIESANPWIDGNNVELDAEVAKMTENSILHQAAITMMSAKIRMFKNALRR